MKLNTLSKLSVAIAVSSLALSAYADNSPAPATFAGLTETQFNQWFPQAVSRGYTYQTLVAAFKKYGVFAGETEAEQVYNLAGFLANAAHESGDFQYDTELAFTDGKGTFTGNMANCQQAYGGTGNVCYYGRGALQLSHDYNYKVYAQGTYENPDLILGSGPTGNPPYDKNMLIDSAVWFWSDQSTGLQQIRPMDGFKQAPSSYSKTNDPFGAAINVINGGIECHASDPVAQAEAADRVTRFLKYLPVLASNAKVQLNPNYESNKVVGVSCTSQPTPPPPPPPLGPNHLDVAYTSGSWATIQCFDGGPAVNVTMNKGPVSITGTDQGGESRTPVTCDAPEGNVTFTYASGVWSSVTPAPTVTCTSSLTNGVPSTLCTIAFPKQQTAALPTTSQQYVSGTATIHRP